MNPTCSHGKRWDEECDGCKAVSFGQHLKWLQQDCNRVTQTLEERPFLASDPSVVIDLYHTISRLSAILKLHQTQTEPSK